MSKEGFSKSKWSIIGHSNIVNYLQSSLAGNRLVHAYLFTGPKNVGKTTVAKAFISDLLGYFEDFSSHPDVYWIEREVNEKTEKRKKNISIEQVRQVQNKLSLSSFADSYKVAVINEAHLLSTEAANSLLKTLEEPTAKTILILLAADTARLPLTVLSRCQVIKFLPVSSQDIYDYLQGQKVDRKKAKALAAMSFGRPGIALNCLENKNELVDYRDEVGNFLKIIESDVNSKFKAVTELVKSREIDGVKEALILWTKILRDVMLVKNSNESFVGHPHILEDLEELSAKYTNRKILQLISQINLSKKYLDANLNSKLTLENLVLNF